MSYFKEIFSYRDMIGSMVRRDLRGRYKGSVLGFLWTFINPLLQLLVYSLVFTVIMRFANHPKYYLFLFVALIPWLFFQTCLTAGATAVVQQKELIKKIYFPREIIPLSFVTAGFVNMLLCFVIVFAVCLFSGITLSPLALLCLPLVMLVEYMLALGVTMLTSALTVYFRDLEHILSILSMAWFYMTPVIYGAEDIPEKVRVLVYLNPMSAVIVAYRDILYGNGSSARVPELDTLMIAVAWGMGLLLVGSFAFARLKKHFAEEL